MKFSIVTPTYNMERWVRETIESTLSQKGDFQIEYIAVNDGSQDRTGTILEEYKKKIDTGTYNVQCGGISMKIINHAGPGGMYNAINEGFAVATGDVYAWINADDTFAVDAFAVVAMALRSYPEIQWLKGISSSIDEYGLRLSYGKCKLYLQQWLRLGIYGQESYFVEQDSVFWKAGLWKKVGGIPIEYRAAGDYWLWLQFARHAPLWSLNVPVSFFRKRAGQISKNIAKYKAEQWKARPKRSVTAWRARLFFSPQSRLLPYFQPFFERLYRLLFPDCTRQTYLDYSNGKLVKKEFTSYIVHPEPDEASFHSESRPLK